MAKRLFPMHLTPFENYMFVDDRPRHPMTFTVIFKLSGKIDREALEKALDETLPRHPLMQAYIRPAKGGRDCWVNSKGDRPNINWGGIDDPIEFADGEYIDVSQEVGIRIWVRHNDERAVLTTQFHHCVCDGIGSYHFLGDLMWHYSTLTGAELDEIPPIDTQSLRNRAQASIDQDTIFDENGKPKTAWREGLHFMFNRTTPIKPHRPQPPKPGETQFPGIREFTFSKEDYKAIRLHAQDKAQTPNDFLMEKLFTTLTRWNQQHRVIPWPQKIAIMLPMDLRDDAESQLPAANVITCAFIRKSGRKLRNQELLVKSLRQDMAEIKRARRHTPFMRNVTFAQIREGFLPWLLKRNTCFATVFLSNTGDPTKRFRFSFPRKKGAVIFGNLVLEDLSGVPPIRPKTRATISIFTYRRALKIALRCDPNLFSGEDTQKLLDLYIEIIRQSLPSGE